MEYSLGSSSYVVKGVVLGAGGAVRWSIRVAWVIIRRSGAGCPDKPLPDTTRVAGSWETVTFAQRPNLFAAS